MGKVVLLCSGKGGTGKTTVTAALGYALVQADPKNRVILVELDSGLRALDVTLGASEGITFDLSDVLMSRCEPVKAIYRCAYMKELQFIPAAFDGQFAPSAHQIARLCSIFARCYDYVLVDAAAGIGREVLAASRAADQILLVTTPDAVAVRDAARLSQALEMCSPGAEQRLVINRVDKAAVQCMPFADFDEIIDEVAVQLIAVIPYDETLRRAHCRGLKPEKGPAMAAAANLARRISRPETPVPLLVTGV